MLSVFGIIVGGLLGSILTLAWDFPTDSDQVSLVTVLGFAMIYAGFGAVPALLFGLPAIMFLKRLDFARWPAAAVLTVGGGLVGGLFIFATFGGFQRFGPLGGYGATAGASIGFVLGLVLFSGPASTVKT